MDPDHDDRFLRSAIALSEQALTDDVGGPFGAVVVRDGVIVARGRNRVLADADPTAHAEVVAVRAAARTLGTHDLTGCVVYTSCEPCPMCWAALAWARIERVVYAAGRNDAAGVGFADARLYAELALPPEERSLQGEQRLHAEAVAVLRAWAARGDHRTY
jgi:tRNA(Arg) A34 adenosine deaminase TadA